MTDSPNRKNVFERNSSQDFRNALSLIVADPETLLFSCVAAAAALTPAIALAASFLFWPGFWEAPLPPEHARLIDHPLSSVAFVMAILFPGIIAGSLFNTAVIGCVSKRLQGGAPTFWDGIKTVAANLTGLVQICFLTCAGASILLWFAYFLHRSEKQRQRIDFAYRGLLGASSHFLFTASTFVLCIMIIEKCRFLEAAERAAKLGEQFKDIFTQGMAVGLAVFLPSMLWMTLAWALYAMDMLRPTSNTEIIAIFAVIPGVLFLLSAIVLAVANLASICAIYLAATRRDQASQASISAYFPGLSLAYSRAE